MYITALYGASVNYTGNNSLCDECTYQPYVCGASVNLTGDSSCDECMYQPYMERHPYFHVDFCEHDVRTILLASVGLTQACPNYYYYY